jgi:dipeptidyl aminopeptidase/acylaminoacyl peptidase
MTNERDPRLFDLYEYATRDYSRRLILRNDQGHQVRAVSPDHRLVATSRIIDNATVATYVYDVAAGRLNRIGPDQAGISSEPQTFSADSRALFYVTDEGREFKALVRMDLAAGRSTTVLQADGDVTGARLSPDGTRLVVDVNQNARQRPLLFDAVSLKPLPLPGVTPGLSAEVIPAPAGPLALVSETDGATPGSVYILNLETGRRDRLLTSAPPGIATADLSVGRVVKFASYDGVIVPGILYTPRKPSAEGPRPAVIHVHGGPGDESRIGYRPLVQYLVAHGYVVFEINNRGSSGSGKIFYHLDDRRHGDADLDDVVAAKRMLVTRGLADPDRVAIQGQSYGGYMALAGLTFRPTEFAAGVDIYGVSNWPRLLAATPVWWEDLRRLLFSEMGDPEKDAAHLKAISPIFHAERIVRPLLVLQGANDPRVLPRESEDIVAKVRSAGTPVDYLVFPDEGHGFRKTANQARAYRAILAFLDRHVKAPRPGASR